MKEVPPFCSYAKYNTFITEKQQEKQILSVTTDKKHLKHDFISYN